MAGQNTKQSFEGQIIYSGMDVHKKQWKISIGIGQTSMKAFSQDPDPDILYNYLCRNYPGGVYKCAYEAGFCGFWIQERLEELGVECVVVNAADIPTTDKERKQKNDKRDSKKILKALQSNQLECIYIPDKLQQDHRSLIRDRERILNDLRRVKNRIKSKFLFYGVGIPQQFEGCCWSGGFISWLKEQSLEERLARSGLGYQIEHLEYLRSLNVSMLRQIRALSKTVRYKEEVKLLVSLPGIGVLTAMKYLTELGSIDRFTTLDKHASFIGLVPNMSSSAEKEGIGRMTKRSNWLIRSALIESAWVAKRVDPALGLKYEQLSKRMPGSKAIVIIAKKLLSRIRFVLKNETLYQKGMIQ